MAARRVRVSRYIKPVNLSCRTCLRCNRDFPSEGVHNRLCQTCLEANHRDPTPAPVYTVLRPMMH